MAIHARRPAQATFLARVHDHDHGWRRTRVVCLRRPRGPTSTSQAILFELKKCGEGEPVQQVDAHDGIDRWRQFESVSAHLRNGGVLWPLKRQQGVLDDVNVHVGKGADLC